MTEEEKPKEGESRMDVSDFVWQDGKGGGTRIGKPKRLSRQSSLQRPTDLRKPGGSEEKPAETPKKDQ